MGNEIDLLVNYPKSNGMFLLEQMRKQMPTEKLHENLIKLFLMAKEGMGMEDLIIILGFGSQLFRHLKITGICKQELQF